MDLLNIKKRWRNKQEVAEIRVKRKYQGWWGFLAYGNKQGLMGTSASNIIRFFCHYPHLLLGSYYFMADFRLTPKEVRCKKQDSICFSLFLFYYICAFQPNWNLVYIWKVHFLLWKNRGSSLGRKFWGSSLVHHWGLWHLLLTPTRFLVEPIEIMHASEKSR